MIGGIVCPLGSGIGYLIWQQAQLNLKVDILWGWYTNHGSSLTGYKPGDEFRFRQEKK